MLAWAAPASALLLSSVTPPAAVRWGLFLSGCLCVSGGDWGLAVYRSYISYFLSQSNFPSVTIQHPTSCRSPLDTSLMRLISRLKTFQWISVIIHVSIHSRIRSSVNLFTEPFLTLAVSFLNTRNASWWDPVLFLPSTLAVFFALSRYPPVV